MNAHTHHPLEIESLESRRLLAVVVELTGSHETLDLPSTNLDDVAKVDICGCGNNVVTLDAPWISESCVDGTLKVISDPGDRIEPTDRGWKFTSARAEGEQVVRQFSNKDAILNLVGPDDFTNPLKAEDVTGNGVVTSWDALVALNELRDREFSDRYDGSIRDVSKMPLDHFNFYDVSGDQRISALDVLCVINRLKENASDEEGAVQKLADPVLPLRLPASDPGIEKSVFSNEGFIGLDPTQVELNDPFVGLVANDVLVAQIETGQEPAVQSSDAPASPLNELLVDSAVLDPTLELCLEPELCVG